MVPAAVGQEIAVVVDRYTAQAVAAEVLGDVGELQRQLAGVAHVERQRGIADHAFTVGVPAHALLVVAIQAGAVAHRAGGIQRTGTFDRTSAEIAVPDLQFDAAFGSGLRLAGHIVDDAASVATAV
ncbi:hypothetical protein D3C73_852830 [compost metagenome]